MDLGNTTPGPGKEQLTFLLMYLQGKGTSPVFLAAVESLYGFINSSQSLGVTFTDLQVLFLLSSFLLLLSALTRYTIDTCETKSSRNGSSAFSPALPSGL